MIKERGLVVHSALVIILTLAVVITLLHRKIEIGHAMLAGSLLLTVLTLSPPLAFVNSVVATALHPNTWEILIALYFVMCLEYQLRTSGLLDAVMATARARLISDKMLLAGMPACVDGAILSKMADRGQIKGAFIDGPLSLDAAIDKESAEIKKVIGPVAGDADCLLFPNIEAGNVFYKSNTKLSGGEQGAMVVGARVPAVLSSRGDSMKTKLYSIALAALVSK